MVCGFDGPQKPRSRRERPPAFSREIHTHIPGSNLVVIPDAGHLHFIEQAETFNTTCLDFLHDHPAA